MPVTVPNSQKKLTNGFHDQAFENTSTSVAASQMRNALNSLSDTVKDPKDKKVCRSGRKCKGNRH
jgi:UTP--glucose-1-phosphate uridylyltransferase